MVPVMHMRIEDALRVVQHPAHHPAATRPNASEDRGRGRTHQVNARSRPRPSVWIRELIASPRPGTLHP